MEENKKLSLVNTGLTIEHIKVDEETLKRDSQKAIKKIFRVTWKLLFATLCLLFVSKMLAQGRYISLSQSLHNWSFAGTMVVCFLSVYMAFLWVIVNRLIELNNQYLDYVRALSLFLTFGKKYANEPGDFLREFIQTLADEQKKHIGSLSREEAMDAFKRTEVIMKREKREFEQRIETGLNMICNVIDLVKVIPDKEFFKTK